jgi:orotate phosphoribosyltransferase-like protein
MANEAVIIELLGDQGDVVRYTVADGAGIAKGTLMQLSSDPRTITATSADGDIFVGIAAEEKVASDGQTSLGVYTHGIFDIKDAGAGITLGNYAKVNGANLIAAADEAGAQAETEIVGQVLETAAASEVVAVLVRKP